MLHIVYRLSFGFLSSLLNHIYVKYDSGQFSNGDKVRSIFVYNPKTNYFDDIVHRIDRLME